MGQPLLIPPQTENGLNKTRKRESVAGRHIEA